MQRKKVTGLGMSVMFVAQVGGPDPGWVGALGPEPSTGLESWAQNPTQPGLGPGWARVELGFAEV